MPHKAAGSAGGARYEVIGYQGTGYRGASYLGQVAVSWKIAQHRADVPMPHKAARSAGGAGSDIIGAVDLANDFKFQISDLQFQLPDATLQIPGPRSQAPGSRSPQAAFAPSRNDQIINQPRGSQRGRY